VGGHNEIQTDQAAIASDTPSRRAAAAIVTSPRKTANTIRVLSSTDLNGGFDMNLLQIRSQYDLSQES
jgi:hypothetical protein